MVPIIYLLRSPASSLPAALYSEGSKALVFALEEAIGPSSGAVRVDGDRALAQNELYSYDRLLEVLLSGQRIITL